MGTWYETSHHTRSIPFLGLSAADMDDSFLSCSRKYRGCSLYQPDNAPRTSHVLIHRGREGCKDCYLSVGAAVTILVFRAHLSYISGKDWKAEFTSEPKEYLRTALPFLAFAYASRASTSKLITASASFVVVDQALRTWEDEPACKVYLAPALAVLVTALLRKE